MTPAQRRLKWVRKDRLPPHLQSKVAEKPVAKKEDKDKVIKEKAKVEDKAAE